MRRAVPVVITYRLAGRQEARGLYYAVGFRPFTRDAPLIKPAV
jgi:hypothetical protein